jgi:hypothetical protein
MTTRPVGSRPDFSCPDKQLKTFSDVEKGCELTKSHLAAETTLEPGPGLVCCAALCQSAGRSYHLDM